MGQRSSKGKANTPKATSRTQDDHHKRKRRQKLQKSISKHHSRHVRANKAPPMRRIIDTATEDRLQDYKFIHVLGQPGHFGECWKAERKVEGKWEECAVKKIAKSRFMKGASRQKKYLEVFRHEIKVMKKMDHPNVIHFYEAFEDSKFLYLSMELCSGGELFKHIENGKLSEKRAAQILFQLLKGLKHMHDMNIAHCDLKPENFVFLNKSRQSPIKIIDFGMARPVPPHVYLTTFAGTPYYTAPEICKGRYNTACDMWSMGVIMFLLLHGFPPFHSSARKEAASSTKEILLKVMKGFDPTIRPGYGAWFPEDIKTSEEARDLMGKLMTKNVKDRYTVDEMIAHPWFVKAQGLDHPIDPRVQTSLVEFRRANAFHTLVLHSLTLHVTEDDEVLKGTFEKMDENHDGHVSFEELRKALSSMDNKELKRIFEEADENHDGVLSLHELQLAYVQRKVLQKEERLWEAFTHIDTGQTMALTLKEVKDALMGNEETKNLMTEEEIEAAFREADCDKDGVVDYDEFLFVMGSDKAPPRAGTLPYHILQESKKELMKLKAPVENEDEKTEKEEAKSSNTS